MVAGCVPQGDRRLRELEGVSVLGVSQIDRVVEAVEETIKGNVVHMLKASGRPRGRSDAGGATVLLNPPGHSHPRLSCQLRETLILDPRLLQKKALPRLDLPKVRRNRFVEFVPLSTG